MLYPGFVGPSYTSQSPNADAELCMNWYPERLESPGAKVQYALYPCPGFTTFASVVQAPVRGMFETGATPTNRCFAVVSFKLYEINSTGAATDRGDVDNDNTPVTFATNGAAGGQMMITSAGSLYVYTLATNNLAKVTTFSGAGITIKEVDFLDGFFLALDAVNSKLYVSTLEDGSTWDLSQVATRTAGSDPWVSMRVILRQIWLLGTLTSEVWYDAGTAPFPFAPIPGAFLEQGCAAPFALCDVDSTLVWLGQNSNGRGVVWRANGYAPVRISTHAVELAIQGYGTISDAVAFAYQDQGHSFYVLTFPTAGATWVYDTVTDLWHQRGYWNTRTGSFSAYRPTSFAKAFDKLLAGDSQTGKIYAMSVTQYQDVDGAAIRRVRRAPHAWDGSSLNWLFYPGLQIDLQPGVGLSTGTTPKVALSWSDNGGLTYPIELDASAGQVGQYGTRVFFQALGRSRDRVWQLVCTDAVPWRVLQAVFRPEPIVGVH